MKEYGVESSWTKVYKIEKGAMPEAFWSIKPLKFSRNGKKVLFQGIHFGRVKFIWYDVEKKRGKSVKIQNFPAMFASSVTSIGSLLLLHGDNGVIGPRQNKRMGLRGEGKSKMKEFHEFESDYECHEERIASQGVCLGFSRASMSINLLKIF